MDPGSAAACNGCVLSLSQHGSSDTVEKITAATGSECGGPPGDHVSVAFGIENHGRGSFEENRGAKLTREIDTDIEPVRQNGLHIDPGNSRELRDVRSDEGRSSLEHRCQRFRITLEHVERIGIEQRR